MCMAETLCVECGNDVRDAIAEGLCPRCLMLRALQPASSDAAGDVSDAQTGRRQVGDYELMDEIARGGMGVVFRAQDRRLGRTVALKLLKGGEWASSDLLERFRMEARASASLVHPNIVPVYAFGEEGGNFFIAMRLIEGGSLAAWSRLCDLEGVSQSSRKVDRRAAEILRKISQAVHHAHQRGILHRDLKPANVLLDATGEPFLTDFGLARLVETDVRLTGTNASLGTPTYMAPEVALGGSGEATVSSDIYGLGSVLYELLTGRPPFEGKTSLEILRQVTEDEARRPSALRKTLDLDLETICLKAISKEPRSRYLTCDDLADDLDRWLKGMPIEARAIHPLERAARWVRRRPLVASLLSLLAVALLVITLGAWQVSRNRQLASQLQRESLLQFNVESANRLAEQNDSGASLAYQLAALRLDVADPSRSEMHRIRLGLTLRDMPSLDRVWRHGDAVTSATFSQDGRWVLSAAADRTARLWNVDDGKEGLVFQHEHSVLSATMNRDGSLVLTICRGGRARCWSSATGLQVGSEWMIRDPYWKVGLSPNASFSPDGTLLLGVSLNRVEIRYANTGEFAYPVLDIGEPASHAAFSPDGKRVVVSAISGHVGVWELTQEGLRPLGKHRHVGGGEFASFSFDGQTVVSVSRDAEANLWEPASGALIAGPLHHTSRLRMGQATFSPVDNLLATLSFDNSIRVWDSKSGMLLNRQISHPRGVVLLRWNTTGDCLVTGSFDGTARVWDARSGEVVESFLRHGAYVVDAAFSSSGRQIVTACQDGGVRLWTLKRGVKNDSRTVGTGKGVGRVDAQGASLTWAGADGSMESESLQTGQVGPLLPHAHRVVAEAFDPTGRVTLTLTEEGSLHIWKDGKQVRSIQRKADKGLIGFMAFDGQGKRFVTLEKGPNQWWLPRLSIWDAATLEARSLPGYPDEVLAHAEFSPDGRWLLTTSPFGIARLWDAETGEESKPPFKMGFEMPPAHFSPDGKWIVTPCTDVSFLPRSARLWSVQSHEGVGAEMLHEDGVAVAVFSPDSRRVATGGEDAVARLWSVPEGQPLTPKMQHENKVTHLCFNQKGTLLATGTSKGHVRLWDARSGHPLMASYAFTSGIASMSFVKGAAAFIATGVDGSVRRWDLTPSRETLEELEAFAVKMGAGGP